MKFFPRPGVSVNARKGIQNKPPLIGKRVLRNGGFYF